MNGKRQNTKRALGVRVWPWVKKIIEKGWQIFTKSFWEAFFDKCGP